MSKGKQDSLDRTQQCTFGSHEMAEVSAVLLGFNGISVGESRPVAGAEHRLTPTDDCNKAVRNRERSSADATHVKRFSNSLEARLRIGMQHQPPDCKNMDPTKANPV